MESAPLFVWSGRALWLGRFADSDATGPVTKLAKTVIPRSDLTRLQTSPDTTMASMSEEDQKRIETVSKFLLQSPPGEINDVLNGTVDCAFDTQITFNV